MKPGDVALAPQLLPGGDSLLFTMASGNSTDRWDKAQIVVQSLKTGARKVVLEGGSNARYVPTGHIVYSLGATFLLSLSTSKRSMQQGFLLRLSKA